MLTSVHNDADDTDDADNADDAADADDTNDYNRVIAIAQMKAFSCAYNKQRHMYVTASVHNYNFNNATEPGINR